MTEKQLAHAVHHGRKVTFAREGRPSLIGYVGGVDADHYLVLVPQDDRVERVLVSRITITEMTLHSESTLADEALCAEIESILRGYRDWVREHQLRITPPKNR